MTEKIRIVYFITSMESGGTERQLALLLEGLAGDTYEKHIVCLSGLGPLTDRYREISASIIDIGYPRLRHQGRIIWRNLPSTVTSVIRLVRVIRKLRPDILHTMIPVCNVMGSIAGKIAGVPVIVCSRLSLGNYRDTNPVLAKLEDWTDRFFTLFHCKSESIKDDVIRREPVDPDLLRVIYNGTKSEIYGHSFDKEPLRQSLGLSLDKPVVGMVANLRGYKGHRDVIQAIPAVLRRHPGARFLFVGRDDGIQAELCDLARSLRVETSIIFAGERHDVPKLLQLMTLLVSASHEEGFSNTIIEAMASGLPVVATRVGGNLEQVADGITGYLVQPRSPQEIADAINQLLDDHELVQKMGRRGNLRVARNFSLKAITDQMMEFYREAIDLEA